MTSWQKPTDEQIERIIALINEPEHLMHFFDGLDNPEWLSPLEARGLFESPPEPAVRGEGAVPFHPTWPQSRYLARMAPTAPDRVFAIVQKLVRTENVSIRGDLVDAAIGLPSDLAAHLVTPFTKWLNDRPVHPTMGTYVAGRLGKLMLSLGEGGQLQAAIRLLKAVLDVERLQLPSDQQARRLGSRDETVARIDAWQYKSILKDDVPKLALTAGDQVLKVLCPILSAALKIARGREAPCDAPDYTSIWRPAIEMHEQNVINERDVADILVSGVRDVADQLVQTDSMTLGAVVTLFGEQERPVFRRLALYLLRRHGDRSPESVTTWLTDRDLFDEVEVHHEYSALAAERFPSLPQRAQATILSWIEGGPDRAETADRLQYLQSRAPTEEEIEQRVRLYQWRHLAPIAEHLPEVWRRRYEELVREFGEPDHPMFLSYSRVEWGDKSPFSLADMRAMTVKEIVNTIQEWRASRDPFAPTVEGLASTLGQMTTEEPARVAQDADSFRGLDPPYLREIMRGFQGALGVGKRFDWAAVLRLCKWVVDQPRDLPTSSGQSVYMDPDWGWTRGAIAHLLYDGLDAGVVEVPTDLREQVWEVLVSLTRDPEPQSGGESEEADVQMQSLNTVRGEAMHAVVRYALWLRRSWERASDSERLGHGLDEMPEVRGVLDEHLNVELDAALAIRAVYGQWFAWLALLDETWTSSRVAAIFPHAGNLTPYWRAAWNTYVTMSPPFDSVWHLLRHEYGRAVDRLGPEDEDTGRRFDPAERLAEHLMVHYWRGNLDLDDEDHILERFFNSATDRVRAHALAYVGGSLQNTEGDIPANIITRLKALWDGRLSAAQTDPVAHRKEIAAFGWWYWASAFDEGWAMQQLLAVLRVGDHIDMDDAVVEHLAKVAPDVPSDAVEALRMLINKTTDSWTLRHWLAEIRRILQTAVESSDPEARSSAQDVIEELGRRGHHDYRDLRSIRSIRSPTPPDSLADARARDRA